jgi:hypothetical protein
VPHGHWKTTTLIAALDYQGMRCAMRLDGAVNALAFQIENALDRAGQEPRERAAPAVCLLEYAR